MRRYPSNGFGRGDPSRPAWRTAMAAETWGALPGNTLQSINPALNASINPMFGSGTAPWLQCNTRAGDDSLGAATLGISPANGFAGMVKAWNGACYDDSAHKLHIVNAGGHGDYFGNERYAIDLSADVPQWQLLWQPSGSIQHPLPAPDSNWITNDAYPDTYGVDGYIGSSLARATYHDGEPRSCHTYNAMQYIPGIGPALSCVPACSGIGNAIGMQSWAFDPITGAKRLICDFYAQKPPIGNDPAAAYDPVRRCLWQISSSTNQLWRINIVSGTFELAGTLQFWQYGGASLFYMEEEDCLLLLSGVGSSSYTGWPNGFQKIPLSGPNKYVPQALSITGSLSVDLGAFPLAVYTNFAAPGVAWDSRRRRFVIWHQATNTKELSTLTPGASLGSTWTAGTLAVPGSGATPGNAVASGTFGRFAYSHTYDGVILFNGTSTANPSNIVEPIYFYAFS